MLTYTKFPPLAYSAHGKFIMSCQNGHRGQILPHVEIFREMCWSARTQLLGLRTKQQMVDFLRQAMSVIHKETESGGLTFAHTLTPTQ